VILLGIANIVLVFLLAPLYEGVLRKVRALVHSRMGPPIWQPYLDILKLLGKEDLRVSDNPMIGLAPLVCFASVMMVCLLTPLGTVISPLAGEGDLILLIAFITLATFAIIIGAAATGSAYAYVGLNRKMMLYLVLESSVVISLLTGVVRSGSFNIPAIAAWTLSNGPAFSMILAAIPFFLAIQGQVCRLPFDIAEADQEIMEGPFIEASGPRLALFKWSFYAKLVIYASLFMDIFVPWPHTGILPLDVLVHLVKILVVVLVVGLIEVVNPRLRIDQALKFYAGVTLVALVALAYAVIGV